MNNSFNSLVYSRKQAMAWWKKLNTKETYGFMRGKLKGRHPMTLTGR